MSSLDFIYSLYPLFRKALSQPLSCPPKFIILRSIYTSETFHHNVKDIGFVSVFFIQGDKIWSIMLTPFCSETMFGFMFKNSANNK